MKVRTSLRVVDILLYIAIIVFIDVCFIDKCLVIAGITFETTVRQKNLSLGSSAKITPKTRLHKRPARYDNSHIHTAAVLGKFYFTDAATEVS